MGLYLAFYWELCYSYIYLRCYAELVVKLWIEMPSRVRSGYLHSGKVVKYVSQKLWVSNNSFHWIRKLHTRFQHLDAEAKKILGSEPLKSLLFKKVLDWIRSPNKIVLERCQFLSFSFYNLTAPTEISFCNYLGFGVPIKNFRNPSQRTWKKSFQQDWSYKKRRNILLSDCKH